jgi:hypothetical protein
MNGSCWRKQCRPIWLLVTALWLASSLVCCSKPASPEARVRALVAHAASAAEAKNLRELKKMISEDYKDGDGRDKQEIVGLIAFHFLRNETIHLLTRVSSVDVPEPGRAEAAVFVAMAGAPITGPEALPGLRADLYRFDFSFADEAGDWKLVRAAWRRAEVRDFLE